VKTAPEVQKLVLDYLNLEVTKSSKEINPVDLSVEGISDNLNLSYEQVEEAVEALSNTKRIDSIKPKFKIWIPNSDEGYIVEKHFCESGLAISGSLNILYSFLLIGVAYFFMFEKPLLVNLLGLQTFLQYSFWSAVLTALSISLGKIISEKLYQVSIHLEKVKGANYYIYILIFFIALAILSIKNKWNLTLIITSILTSLEIFLVLFKIINYKEK